MSASNSMPSSGPSTEGRVYEPSMEEILASIRRIIADDQSLPGRDMFRQEPAADVRQAEVRQAEVRPADPPRSEPPPPEAQLRDAPAAPKPVDAPVPAVESVAPSQAADPGLGVVASPQSTIRWLTSEPADQSEPVSQDLSQRVLHPEAHGRVAAPQYAAPDGRAFGDDSSDPLAHPEPALETAAQSAESHPHELLDETPEPDPTPPTAEMFDEPIEPHSPAEPALGGASLFSSATDTAVSSAFNVLAASRLAANSDEIMNLVREMIRPLLRNWLDDNLPSMVERMVRDEIERVARGGR